MEQIEIIRYINRIVEKNELTSEEKQYIFSTPEIGDYIINKTNSKTFKKIMNLVDNPLDFIDKRIQLEKLCVDKINEIDVSNQKDVIAQIYFGDYANNSLYSIDTILERIDSSEKFKKKFDNETISFLRELQDFFKNSKEYNSQIDINSFVAKLNSYQDKLKESHSSMEDLIYKLFLFAQKDFRNEISSALENNNFLNGIIPRILKSSSGNDVKFFSLQCQTEAQKDFYLLSRTNYIQQYMFKSNAMEEYTNSMAQKDYLSYSLINAEQYSGFVQKSRITFGYFSLGENDLMSANTHDGQTNQYTLRDNFYVIKQQYLGLNDFMNKTDSYNEIVLKNSKPLQPSCIIIYDRQPNDEIIDIASNMNLPIIYLDPQYYKKHIPINPVSEQERMNNWYRHDNYLDYDLSTIIKVKEDIPKM